MTSRGLSSASGKYVFLVLVLLLLIAAVWLVGRAVREGTEEEPKPGSAGKTEAVTSTSGPEVWNEAVALAERQWNRVTGLSFPAYRAEFVKPLSGGIYPTFRVKSTLSYVNSKGERIQKGFACVIAKIGNQWKLVELEPDSLSAEE